MKIEFHHINYVSENIEELYVFYQDIMQMDTISPKKFPRTTATDKAGYDGKIKFVTEGTMQMHIAEQDLTIANKHNQEINHVEKGHIAFRTDDIDADVARLREKGYQFTSDEPTPGAHGARVIFIHPKSCDGVLIELSQPAEAHS